MTLKFNIGETEELMKSFYLLSGIRMVLFDDNFKELIAYPKESCDFCKMMRSHSKTQRKCSATDRKSIRTCEKNNSLVIYNCHAGLVEAIIPLHENEKIIGFLMFGQVTDNPDKTKLTGKISLWSQQYSLDEKKLRDSISKITFKSKDEIQAAAKIMEACTSYIVYKELITPENNRIIKLSKQYIDENLGADFDIGALCCELQIGRTKLYGLFKTETKMGVAEYLRHRRMHRAKKLLKTTDLPISIIAEQVGFSDYNYFSRVYKKTYNKSPRSYR